ncbi:restriction endonuclease subunit S [Halomonas sp.]|uniref:restriction endonuclease subunit S n=1 Tax=Halomonas sp. TaxID=1486246 RepID=UPI003D0D6211
MSFGEDIVNLVASSPNALHGKHPSWSRVKLNDVATLINGFAFKSKFFSDQEGAPVVRIRDILKGVPGTFYQGPTDDPKITSIENGHIVIGMDGDFNCRMWGGGKAFLNQRVCALQSDESFYSQKFLSLALPGYLKLVNEHTSSVTVKHLSSLTVRDIPLPLPPLNEQRRIVDKIDSLFAQLDHGEATLRDVQKLLARYRQSVLKAAVTGQLTADWRAENADRLESGSDLLESILQARCENWQGRGKYKEPMAPDTSGLPELPEVWVWASIDQMVDVFRNGLSKKPVAEKNQYPILRISAVRPMRVTLNDLRYYSPDDTEDVSSYWVEKGDLLFTRYSGSAQFVGVCGQMRDPVSVLHPDKLIKLRVVDTPELCRDFLEIAWNAGVTRAHIASNIKTTSGQQGIAGRDIKSAPFPLPPADEQVVIAERVWDAFEKIERLQSHCQAELTRSAALRQSTLKDAFAGKLVPQDPDDEPASELLARIRAERDAANPKKRTRKKVTA